MKRLLSLVALATLSLACTTHAATFAVTNYNWLQLPPDDGTDPVTATIGGAAGGGSGYGAPVDFRWGHHAWIPNGTLTADGAGDYWAQIDLGSPRPTSSVRVQWWCHEGTGIKTFTVQASADGAAFTDVGAHDYGTMQVNASRFYADVPVTEGDYRYIRVLIKTGDYQYGSATRGGPGLYVIEPRGTASVAENQANWAHATFGTAIENHLAASPAWNGLRWNDGSLIDDEGVRTGELNPWSPADHVIVDLKATRPLNRCIVVWDSYWWGANYTVEVSNDKTTWTAVTGQSASVTPGNSATLTAFETITGRYVKISGITAGGTYGILNQVMVYGPVVTKRAVQIKAY